MAGWEWVAPTVSVTGALVSVGGFGYTIWRGSRELDRWRTERRESRRAEVAGEVLLVALKFVDGLESLTVIDGFVWPPPSNLNERRAAAERLAENIEREWRKLERSEDALRSAEILAQAYLPDENVRPLFRKLWEIKSRLRARQKRFLHGLRNGIPRNQLESVAKDIYGFEALGCGLRDQALNTLRPFVQLRSDT